MKFALVIGAVVIICLGVGAWLIWGQPAVVAPTALITPDPEQEFTDTTNGGIGGQFIQLAPTDVSALPEAEATTVGGSPEPSAVTDLSVATVTVHVDETGFTPQAITITAGTTVSFINDGQGQHWPASDVHPTHTILPEFDSKRSLETGETYSYTFTKAGTWRCHDHLAASNTCTITVE